VVALCTLLLEDLRREAKKKNMENLRLEDQKLVLSSSEFETEAPNVRTAKVVESCVSRNMKERDRLANLVMERKIILNRMQPCALDSSDSS
jgi:hypothetical protein